MVEDLRGLSNNGWGELVDRIIAGSSQGVAVNPRAEKLVITVRNSNINFKVMWPINYHLVHQYLELNQFSLIHWRKIMNVFI